MMGLASGRQSVRRARRRYVGFVRDRLEGGAAHVRRVPLPEPVRSYVANPLIWESGETFVPTHQLLLGGQNGLRGAEYALAIQDPMWTSRRVADGPHAALLRAASARRVSDHELLESDYAEMARQCIAVTGSYFGASDDRGILHVARQFVEPDANGSFDDPAISRPDSPILAVPIQGSDCYQVVDGHHRVARLAVAGELLAPVRLRRRSVRTPLQDLLDKMSWIGGERELYQPLDAPELAMSWTTVRRCSDRLELMQAQLRELGLQRTTYLDVASCYGWFLAAMADAGHDVQGVERDPLGRTLAAAAYGLDPTRVTTDDAVAYLTNQTQRFDVVSCFSLLHHFALGRGAVSEVELLRLLDNATRRVLFLDTGQSHEAWFSDSLPQWDTAYVKDFLERHGTFDRVVDLGPDHDAVAPYEHNYGRHLFACIRDA